MQYVRLSCVPVALCCVYVLSTAAAQWEALHDSASTGANVFGILNPASGPGAHTQPNYLDTIDYVKGAGAKVFVFRLHYAKHVELWRAGQK